MITTDTDCSHWSTLADAALDALPTPILIHDHHCVLYANLAALDALGARVREEIVGQPLSGIVHPDGAEAGKSRRSVIMERGHAVTDVPVKLVGVDGEVRYATVSGRPIRWGDGERAILVTATLTRVGSTGGATIPQ